MLRRKGVGKERERGREMGSGKSVELLKHTPFIKFAVLHGVVCGVPK